MAFCTVSYTIQAHEARRSSCLFAIINTNSDTLLILELNILRVPLHRSEIGKPKYYVST